MAAMLPPAIETVPVVFAPRKMPFAPAVAESDPIVMLTVAVVALRPAPPVEVTSPADVVRRNPVVPVNGAELETDTPVPASFVIDKLEKLRSPVTLTNNNPEPPTPFPALPIESVPPFTTSSVPPGMASKRPVLTTKPLPVVLPLIVLFEKEVTVDVPPLNPSTETPLAPV